MQKKKKTIPNYQALRRQAQQTLFFCDAETQLQWATFFFFFTWFLVVVPSVPFFSGCKALFSLYVFFADANVLYDALFGLKYVYTQLLLQIVSGGFADLGTLMLLVRSLFVLV